MFRNREPSIQHIVLSLLVPSPHFFFEGRREAGASLWWRTGPRTVPTVYARNSLPVELFSASPATPPCERESRSLGVELFSARILDRPCIHMELNYSLPRFRLLACERRPEPHRSCADGLGVGAAPPALLLPRGPPALVLADEPSWPPAACLRAEPSRSPCGVTAVGLATLRGLGSWAREGGGAV